MGGAVGFDATIQVLARDRLLDRLAHLGGGLFRFETFVADFLVHCEPRHRRRDFTFLGPALELIVHPLAVERLAHQRLERGAFYLSRVLALSRFESDRFGAEIGQVILEPGFVLYVALAASPS